jgi:hypothetical protein
MSCAVPVHIDDYGGIENQNLEQQVQYDVIRSANVMSHDVVNFHDIFDVPRMT